MAQQYYPESLAHGYVCYPPLLFNVLWRAAQPFLDAVTKCAAAAGFGFGGRLYPMCLHAIFPMPSIFQTVGIPAAW